MGEAPTVPVADGVAVEVHHHGEGEPLLLIQTALAPEELAPFAREPVIAGRFRTIDLRRRGYGASSPAYGPGSVTGTRATVWRSWRRWTPGRRTCWVSATARR